MDKRTWSTDQLAEIAVGDCASEGKSAGCTAGPLPTEAATTGCAEADALDVWSHGGHSYPGLENVFYAVYSRGHESVDIFTAGSGHRLRTFKPSPSGAFIFIVDPSGTRIAFYNMWKADLKIYHLWSGAVISNCSRVGLPTSPQFPFSFKHDGRRLVAPRRDSRLLGCWDTTTGHRIFDLDVSSVPGIRFYCHSGNDHILVLNSEPAVTVFDSETGVPSLRFGLPAQPLPILRQYMGLITSLLPMICALYAFVAQTEMKYGGSLCRAITMSSQFSDHMARVYLSLLKTVKESLFMGVPAAKSLLRFWSSEKRVCLGILSPTLLTAHS
jgi:hypothetical protein